MRQLCVFAAIVALTCFAATPNSACADDLGDLEVTMEVLDDTSGLDFEVSPMRGPESPEDGSRDALGEDEGDDADDGFSEDEEAEEDFGENDEFSEDEEQDDFSADDEFSDDDLSEEGDFEEGEDIDDDEPDDDSLDDDEPDEPEDEPV